MLISFIIFYSAALLLLVAAAQGTEHRRSAADDSYRSKERSKDGEDQACHLGDVFIASIGLSILNLCDLDLASKTFYAEGMTWLKYSSLPEWLDHWDQEIIDSPAKALRFVNSVDRHDLELELEPLRPVVDSDGLYIQWLKFSGRFVANELDLRRFPFETINLPVEVELEDLYASETRLRYQASGSLIATGANLAGYKIDGCEVAQSVHTYRTNWGWELAVSCNGGPDIAEFDNIRATIQYSRSIRSSLLNIFLPLAVMMCVVMSVPLIDIQQHENRVVIPASVLLVLVFLQEGYKKILPPGLSYPTLADLVYAACFVVTIGVFGLGLMTANWHLSAEESGLNVIGLINRSSLDIWMASLIFLIISVALMVILTGRGHRRATPLP